VKKVKIENGKYNSVKWLKGTKLELEDALVVWIGQVNAKNGTAADEVIKEQAKVI
jgi:hypothetical protein